MLLIAAFQDALYISFGGGEQLSKRKSTLRASKRSPIGISLASLLFALPLVVVSLLNESLTAVDALCLALPLWLGAYGCAIVGLGVCVLFLVKRWDSVRYWPALPLVALSVMVFALLNLPFWDWSKALDFKWKEQDRLTVVRMLEEDFRASSNVKERRVQLPPRYAYLSSGGGDVLVSKNEERLVIIFYHRRGMLESGSWVITYVSDDTPPQSFRDDLAGTRIQEHWFLAVTF